MEDNRAEVPCLAHGDSNPLNIIVGGHAVTLIDWDLPAVRFPLAELSALDEHVYLAGRDGLPPVFFTGYGRTVPADLLLAWFFRPPCGRAGEIFVDSRGAGYPARHG